MAASRCIAIAIMSVPTDTSTKLATVKRKLGLARTPIAPMMSVKMPIGHNHGIAILANAPASSPKMTVWIRKILYTPTFVIIANRAATGALATAYVFGSQKLSGSMAALRPNTTSNSSPPDFTRACSWSPNKRTLLAISAMFNEPIVP